jgi:hypothetical protein
MRVQNAVEVGVSCLDRRTTVRHKSALIPACRLEPTSHPQWWAEFRTHLPVEGPLFADYDLLR